MKAILLAAAALVLLAGCERFASEGDQAIEAAQKLLQDGLNDPASAQFREVTFNPAGGTVCGEFNAKNRMGGYGGFTPFYVVNGLVRIQPDPGAAIFDEFERKDHERSLKGFTSMWDDLCLKSVAD